MGTHHSFKRFFVRAVLLTVVLCLVLLSLVPPAIAGAKTNLNPRVLLPHSHAFGATYEE